MKSLHSGRHLEAKHLRRFMASQCYMWRHCYADEKIRVPLYMKVCNMCDNRNITLSVLTVTRKVFKLLTMGLVIRTL